MARALETDPIKRLEEIVLCSACLETLRDPRTLPCFHSFCKCCLERIVKACRDKAPRDQLAIREFHCPNCRMEFTLDPDKQVANMPQNHFIRNMVRATAVLDRGIGIPCSHNCSQCFSVARCITCEKFLCRECLSVHNTYRGHDGHSVLSMEELSKPDNQKKIQGKMYCNKHSGKTLEVYCETCDQLICKDCMDFQHLKQNHSCFLVKDVANSYKELLASNNSAMENALEEGNAFLDLLSLATEQLNQDTENANNRIMKNKDAVLKTIAEMLERKAAMLSKEVEQIHKGERAKLDGLTRETKHYVENIKQSVQLSKKLVEQGTEQEIISSQKMMLDSAKNRLTKRPDFFNEPICWISKPSCDSMKQFKEVIFRSLGTDSLEEVSDDKVATRTVSRKELIKGKNLNVDLQNTETKPNVKMSETEESVEKTRTILVSGLPQGATENNIHFHLGQKMNGGGDIEKVIVFPGRNAALVVFEDHEETSQKVKTTRKIMVPRRSKKTPTIKTTTEVKTPVATPEAQRAAKTEQILEEESFREDKSIAAEARSVDQVLSMVTATINPMLLETASQHFWGDVLNFIQRTFGMHCQTSYYGVLLTGSLSQVTKAGELLASQWRKHS